MGESTLDKTNFAESLEPGDKIRLNGKSAEVIRVHEVGGAPYLRAVIEGDGIKSVSLADVTVEKEEEDELDAIPLDDIQSAEHFDLRVRAIQLRLAHNQGKLLSISNSLVRLEPYQLACVNEVMSKLRQRVLIADDVGLGKTIEAGLLLKELEARRRADRVLFVVPAHLQEKWIRDMDRFFDIRLTQANRTWVDGERHRLGEETNIWKQEGLRLVTSMAFLRQKEFDEELEDAFWDVVVVDECHKASKRGKSPSVTSKRVEQVSHNSDSLILLSATPHDGKEKPFRSLISYIDPFRVAKDQELDRETVDEVMVRRGKDTIFDDDGERIFPNRDVQTVELEMTPSEKDLYDAVTHYVREIFNRSERLNAPVVGFAMALMQKRLVSSVGAIRETLRRRLQGLLEIDEISLSAEAEAYVDGDDLEEDDQVRVEQELEKLTVPGADEEYEAEIEALRKIVKQAEELPVDTKGRAFKDFIQKLVAENPNEKILLFTEYRDTLDYLLDLVSDEPWSDEILTIHGGVDKEDRSKIEHEFNYGRSRFLFCTDAASEGIDLQHSCHIMVNYELPWNPNRLEQRIGRIHRYGQEKEVKVWNFQFTDTRESQVFELLQDKIDNIRDKVGATADVLGILDGLDVESLVMRSLRDNKPISATKEELEEEFEKRQQTLLEWYDRSLIDCTTFDSESRRKIQEVVDESEDIFGTEDDLQEFIVQGVETLGGRSKNASSRVFDLTFPDKLETRLGSEIPGGPFTTDRDLAMRRDDVTFLAPDSSLVQALIEYVLESERLDSNTDGFGGSVGMKILPFLERPGITYVYRTAFEDGTDEVLQEELWPVFVDSQSLDARTDIGQKVLDGTGLTMSPDLDAAKKLLDQEPELREAAERQLTHDLSRQRSELVDKRRQECDRELEHVEEYRRAERQRLEEFISNYEAKQAEGEDMEIAIQGQRHRLKHLEERTAKREENIRRKAQVVSLEPELVGVCLSLVS